MEMDSSYKLQNVTVRVFNGVKYLSLSTKSEVVAITDIGEVVEESSEEVVGGSGGKVISGEIVGVASCETYDSCRNCHVKVTATGKCGMKMKLSKCEKCFAARLVIDGEDGKEYKATAFTRFLEVIVGGQLGSVWRRSSCMLRS